MAKAKAKKQAEDAAAPARAAWSLDPAHLSTATMTGIVLGVHVVLLALVFDPTIFTGGDNGVYVALSRSLLERHAYLSIHDPSLSPHTLYPPGYPAILALASLVGIQPWVPLKVVAAAFSALGVAFTCLWLRRRTTPGIALFAALLVAISPGLLGQSHYELSDVPFWAMVMIVLWALEALPREHLGRAAIAGIALAVAYLTRTAGIPLVVGAFAWFAYERRWKQLAIFAAFVVPAFGGWWLWTHTHAAADLTYGQYTSVFWLKSQYEPELGQASIGDVLMRIVDNGMRYAQVIIPALLTGRGGGALGVVGAAVIVLSTVGLVRRLRRPGIDEIYFPLYAGMIAVLPLAWGGERYLFPILPLALVYAAETVEWLLLRSAPGALKPAGLAAAVVVILLAAGPLSQAARVGSLCRGVYTTSTPYACLPAVWQDYLGAADWARSSLPENAVVISRKPGLFFALSDRQGIDIPKTTDPDEFFRTAEKANARYLVVDRVDALTMQYSVPVITKYPAAFCLVKIGTVEGSAVLGVRWEAERVAAADSTEDTSVYQCPKTFATASQ